MEKKMAINEKIFHPGLSGWFMAIGSLNDNDSVRKNKTFESLKVFRVIFAILFDFRRNENFLSVKPMEIIGKFLFEDLSIVKPDRWVSVNVRWTAEWIKLNLKIFPTIFPVSKQTISNENAIIFLGENGFSSLENR